MFIASLFIIVPNWKQLKYLFKGKWKKIYSVYKMEYYSLIKRSKLQKYTTQTNLKNIMLIESSQTQKIIYCTPKFI